MTQTLLCLGPAGAGPSFFADWATAPSRFTVVPLCLPGRETHFADDPLTSVPLLAESVLGVATEAIEGATRVVVFGHSFGASVAYELSRLLEASGHGDALTLAASGSAAPGRRVGAETSGLGDVDFVATVEANAGYAHPALADPELVEILLPALRADVEAYECYRPAWGSPAAFPVVTLRGDGDALVSRDEAARWSEVTSGDVWAREVSGTHMYVVDRWRDVLGLLEDAVLSPSRDTEGV